MNGERFAASEMEVAEFNELLHESEKRLMERGRGFGFSF